ncbi:MAG: hypothetical protein ETSY1_02470 [Candidatus Entotheonella factor]|uniref:Acyl-CoA dehydrogenase n=1 Tax=Entotheonella factor TaxID=1429438 RepID=W4LXW8_ENTF1|nr:acyl-CoA dehydrogenase family protein [Candidatus Entotheonella palauensis]ETX02743.1 MAG: hypothetical protein ETSY1_02470 [Candidatus Entotheonella factor]
MTHSQSDAIHALRTAAEQFCEAEVRPILAEFERTETFPHDLAKKMGAAGYLAGTLPAAYGGTGIDLWGQVAICEVFGRYLSVRQYITVHNLLNTALWQYGHHDLQSRYLRRIATGELLAAYCLTEPNGGSDAYAMETRAVRDGDHWRLTGQKTLITLANSADVFMVMARTLADGDEHGITAFLVEREWGVETAPLKGKLGQRASDLGTVFFDDVVVPDANRIGGIGQGFKIAMAVLDVSRIETAAAAVGLSQVCVDVSTRYAKSRLQFGKPIAGFQLVQEHLAEMIVDTDASRALTYRSVQALLTQGRATQEIAVAKYYATEAAVRNANRAIQIHGGYGYLEAFEVERLARDARVLTLYEGTSEIMKLLIAGQHTGIKAFQS